MSEPDYPPAIEPLAFVEEELPDDSLSPIRTRHREETFRLRDAMISLAVGIGLFAGVWALWSYGPVPEFLIARSDVGYALASVITVATVLLLAQRRRLRVGQLFVIGPWYVEVFWGLAACAGIWIAFEVAASQGFRPVDPLTQELARSDLLTRWGFLFLAALFAPLAEEVVFRGAVQSSLYPRAGASIACLSQAAVFGAVHLRGWEIMVSAGVIGVCLGALALWRGSLLAPMVAHGVWNGLFAAWMIVAYYLSIHVPAATMDEARVPPTWALAPTTFGMPLHLTAEDQFFAAQEKYGMRGWMLPKDEIRALRLVAKRFPENDEFGGWSRLRIAQIYLDELRDPRRTIAAGEETLRLRSENQEIQAAAIWTMIAAQVQLRDRTAAEELLVRLERDYAEVEWVPRSVGDLRVWIEESLPAR